MWRTWAHLFHPQRSNNHRPRVLHPQAYIVYVSLGCLFLAGVQSLSLLNKTGAVLGFASSITPEQVIEKTNAERKTIGLPTLTLNDQLTQAAQKKGQDMFASQYWAHVSPTGKEPWSFMREAGYDYQAAGENLARDFSSSDPMMQAWMASPTHRANIVNPKYTQIGIAVIDGTLNGYETTLVVQMFGVPRVQVAQVEAGQTTAAEVESEAVPVMAVEAAPAPQENQLIPSPAVLARALVPIGSLERAPLFSPLQLSKVFFLAMIMIIILTLLYDTAVIGHRRTMRLVGQNMGHILFLLTAGFLLILFKGGIIR